jgi:hypothetical protein
MGPIVRSTLLEARPAAAQYPSIDLSAIIEPYRNAERRHVAFYGSNPGWTQVEARYNLERRTAIALHGLNEDLTAAAERGTTRPLGLPSRLKDMAFLAQSSVRCANRRA